MIHSQNERRDLNHIFPILKCVSLSCWMKVGGTFHHHHVFKNINVPPWQFSLWKCEKFPQGFPLFLSTKTFETPPKKSKETRVTNGTVNVLQIVLKSVQEEKLKKTGPSPCPYQFIHEHHNSLFPQKNTHNENWQNKKCLVVIKK